MKRLNFLQRKGILFSPKTSPQEAIRWGDRYLEARRLHEAAAFYLRAQHAEGLAGVRQAAVAAGDLLLLLETYPPGDLPPAGRGELEQLARQAESVGRWCDARRAYEQLQDAEGVRRVLGAVAGTTEASAPEGSGAGRAGAASAPRVSN